MKIKRIFVVLALVLGLAPLSYGDDLGTALERANRTAVKGATSQSNIPTEFSREKQALFNEYLKRTESTIIAYGTQVRGLTDKELNDLVITVLEGFVEGGMNKGNGKGLTSDEKRAVKYAIYVLMIENKADKEGRYEKYRSSLGYTQQYQEDHKIENWNQYVRNCLDAMDAFYTTVKESESAEFFAVLELACNHLLQK